MSPGATCSGVMTDWGRCSSLAGTATMLVHQNCPCIWPQMLWFLSGLVPHSALWVDTATHTHTHTTDCSTWSLNWSVNTHNSVDSDMLTLVMLTPVRPSTVFGSLSITSSTSPVNLAAPTSPLPIDTIFTAFVCASGAAISAATWSQPTALPLSLTIPYIQTLQWILYEHCYCSR